MMIEKNLEREIELVNLLCDGLRLDPKFPENPAHLYNAGSCMFIEKAVSTWKDVISKLINVFDYNQNPEQLAKIRNLSTLEKSKINELLNITYRSSFRLKTVVSHLKQEFPDFILEVNNYLDQLKSIEKILIIEIGF